MELTDLQRLKKVVKWLIFSDFGDNEKEIAELLGYKKSSFSQIMNGKVPISDKFIDNIISVDKNINKVWIKTGKGEMLKTPAKAEGPAQQVAETQEAYNKVAHLEEKIAFLQRENQLLQENKALLEDKVKSLKEKESRRIQELEEEIARLTQENHAIKSQPQDRAVE